MLAVIPVRDGTLPSGGAETVAECAGRALLIGSGTVAASIELGGLSSSVSVVEAGAFAPGSWAAALEPHLDAETEIVLPASPDGRDLAPRLAGVLGYDLFAGAVSVRTDHVALARHGGLVITDVHPLAPFVATLQPGVRGVAPVSGAEPPAVVELAYDRRADACDVPIIETLAPDAATMDLAESPRILGGGAGLQSEESFAQLTRLSVALDASVGATRVITDRGWVGHERQIGTTGVVVSPKLYLAFGISGAVQHTSGLGEPDHIISINTDPHCPMMQLADIAIVADADAVVGELLAQLSARAVLEPVSHG